MWKYLLSVLCIVLCTGCRFPGSEKEPTGVYEISAEGTAYAEFLTDASMFYHWMLKNSEESEKYLLQALDKNPDSKYLVYVAARRLKEGKLAPEKAVELARLHPEGVYLCDMFGEILWQIGKKDLAEELITSAIAYRLDPPSEGAAPRGFKDISADFQIILRSYLQLAFQKKEFKKADVVLEKFVVLAPEKLENATLISLIEYYVRANKNQKSEFYQKQFRKYTAELRKVLEAPNHFFEQIDRNFIIALLEENENKLVELLLTESLLTKPADALPYSNLVLYYAMKAQSGMMERALAFEILFFIKQNDALPKHLMQLMLNLTLDIDAPQTLERQIVSLEQEGLMNDELYSRVTEYYISKGNTANARRYLKKVRSATLRELLLGGILQRERKYKEAMQVFMKLERMHPNSSYIKMMAADMALRAGENEIAEQFLNEMLLKAEKHPDYQNFVGYIWAEKGINLDRAEQLVESALKADPKNAAYLDSMAWIAFKKKNYAKAEKYILKALACIGKLKTYGVILDHAGDIFHALGKTQKARECWQKAIQNEDPEVDAGLVMEKLNPALREAPAAQNQGSGEDDRKTGSAVSENPQPSTTGNKE